jgi:hypothetical protein
MAYSCPGRIPRAVPPIHHPSFTRRHRIMNSIIWVVGLVVIVVAALSFFGLR